MAAVGRRYAKALYGSLEGVGPGQVLAELEGLVSAFTESPRFRKIFENPAVSHREKDELVADLKRQVGLSEVAARFLGLVVARGRLRDLPEAASAFRDLCDEASGVSRAKLITARPVSRDKAERVSARLSAILGRPVELETAVCERLVGGVQVQVGSTVYDGSIAGVLKSLCRILVKG